MLKRLGLQAEPVSTQVVPRDRHAELLEAIALAGAGLERLATEIRHLARTELGEAREPFTVGQKGSSAMPHKRNPIKTEQITGLARLLRGYSQAALENVALWHERDISHSSVERIVLPDATILLDHMQRRMLGVSHTARFSRSGCCWRSWHAAPAVTTRTGSRSGWRRRHSMSASICVSCSTTIRPARASTSTRCSTLLPTSVTRMR